MAKMILWGILILLVVRAVSRLHARRPRRGRVSPTRCPRSSGVQLVRDPVCGVFVVPGQALTTGTGTATQYFCSEKCRERAVAPRQVISSEGAAARRHRRGRPPAVRARLHGVERRQHQRAARRRTAADDADERLQGLHDRRDDVHHRSRREEARRRAQPVVRDADAPRGVPPAARDPGGRARASADGDGVRRRRHSARSRGARGGRDDAGQRADCGVRDAVDEGAAGGGRASTSRRTTACCSRITAR